MKLPNIINVQRFSIHDGKGIRTTVFFKGCPLSCQWCHNPESQSFERQLMFDKEKCTGCGACTTSCSAAMDWKTCHRTAAQECGFGCVKSCIWNARCIVGEQMSIDALMAVLLRDRAFYERSGGGVTLSGGEVMVQDMEYLTALLKRLSKEEIPVNIDTCGEASYERFLQVMDYTDTFLYDMKAVSDDIHKAYTGKSNIRILDNLKRLSADKAKINLRIPVIAEVNGGDSEMEKMLAFVKEFVQVTQVNLLPYHRAGSDKWGRLGMEDKDMFSPPAGERMEQLRQMWLSAGISPVYIGG